MDNMEVGGALTDSMPSVGDVMERVSGSKT